MNNKIIDNPVVEQFKYWTQQVLPQVYDDSLSYTELLQKVVTKLNDIIKSVNVNTINITELVERWNHIDEFLLPVTNQIMQEWLKDGTIEKLINIDILNKKMNYFKSLQEAKMYKGVFNGMGFKTGGYWKEGDGGGANYLVSDVGIVDEGAVVSLQYNLKGVIIERVFDVKMFGAKGDGINDDSIHIQKAFNACKLSGGNILFSSGTYMLKTLQEVPTVAPQTAENMFIVCYSNTHVDATNAVLTYPDNFVQTHGYFQVMGNSDMYTVKNSTFRNMHFNNNGNNNLINGTATWTTPQNCLRIRHAENIIIDHCTFTNNSGLQFVDIGWLDDISATNVTIKDCIFSECGNSIIGNLGQKDHSSIYLSCDNALISNCIFLNKLTASEATFTGGNCAIELHCQLANVIDCNINNYTNCIIVAPTQKKHYNVINKFSNCYINGAYNIQVWNIERDRISQLKFENCDFVLNKFGEQSIGMYNSKESSKIISFTNCNWESLTTSTVGLSSTLINNHVFETFIMDNCYIKNPSKLSVSCRPLIGNSNKPALAKINKCNFYGGEQGIFITGVSGAPKTKAIITDNIFNSITSADIIIEICSKDSKCTGNTHSLTANDCIVNNSVNGAIYINEIFTKPININLYALNFSEIIYDGIYMTPTSLETNVWVKKPIISQKYVTQSVTLDANFEWSSTELIPFIFGSVLETQVVLISTNVKGLWCECNYEGNTGFTVRVKGFKPYSGNVPFRIAIFQ